jgi:Fe-S-cluster containining protein
MRLQILDDSVRFACHSCGACCDQPWATLIEPEKARALSNHDFSKYPQLASREFFKPAADKNEKRYELAKGEGTRCLFLDDDNLCIIHKELGPDAKPDMCLQFPFLPARTWTEDRVSANFGCPSVQQCKGEPLSNQADEIRKALKLAPQAVHTDRPVPLHAAVALAPHEADAFFDRAGTLFDPDRDRDMWSRFAEVLALIAATVHAKNTRADNEPIERQPTDEPDADLSDVPRVTPAASPYELPMQARFLFAATLYPDTLPTGAAANFGVFKRLTLVPKLMALSRLSGTYASRILGRNVSITEVLAHPIPRSIDPAGARLLCRCLRSRLWQRFPCGTRLNITAGVHQHILDLNAVLFYARADACAAGETELTEARIARALQLVEFHLANQKRLYDHTLKGWIRAQLDNPALALQSLRIMVPAQCAPAEA